MPKEKDTTTPELVEKVKVKMGATGKPSLKVNNGLIYEEARQELRFPQSSRLFKQMGLDSNIASAMALIEAVISSADWKVEAPDSDSTLDVDIAEKLNYNLKIMDRDFSEYISEALSYLTYGFHTSEKIYTRHTGLPVGDFIGWKDFRTISQDTISKWLFDNETGDLKGLEQDLGSITSAYFTPLNLTGKTKIDIPRKKFLHFRYNSKRNNPEGVSPLRANYVAWKYRSLIEEFETIYATKGLGGVLDLGIDVAYLAKASIDPTSSEALVVQDLKTSAANFHNGDTSYTITPLAYSNDGKPLFHTKILETTPPNTNDIIKRHDHRILMTFFADVLSLGSDGSGSFALAEGKAGLLTVGIKHHLNILMRALNHDLIKQTYEQNGWPYDARTACQFTYQDIDPDSLAEFAGAVQKVLAVNGIDRTTDVEDVIRDRVFGLGAREDVDTEVREVAEGASRSGDGMTSGLPNGVGDSTSSGEDRSVGNTSGETV